jgi:hypothetical protein
VFSQILKEICPIKEAWLHPSDRIYQNKQNSSFQIKRFLLYSLNGRTLFKKERERKKTF